ncbi:L-rhamnose mutarotase [Mesorhizobium sp. PAMC28654]|uniref:L-rhamnose mutarotase n=1 Tax=Mesorhizobium sp. PAMC28654 TaxID=2880934 RepID=UPI001D0A253A|nr:L-rhamnose mutarotase [Mesorhizobium sp. PAMC28654]UDL92595.1 L-rhamnose mutarotase [Mesorhizobium sp. PAMC28654]
MTRMGLCIGLKPEVIAHYKELHAAVWPEVLAAITAANIRNYSIFLREPENLLFATWEYVGGDFDADMELMKQNPAMQEWWTICDPLQQPLETRAPGEWWARMEPVFFHA